MPPCNCHPPFPRPEPFSPLPRPGKVPDWGKWIRDRLAEKGALLVFPTRASFPNPGAWPNLYLDLETGAVYRWENRTGYAVLVDPREGNDVLVYDSVAAFPDEGEQGKLYIAANTGSLHRWGGEGYVALLPGKADKAVPQTAGNFAALTQDGNLADSGVKPSDFATAAQGAKADTAVQSIAVGTSTVEPGEGGVLTLPVSSSATSSSETTVATSKAVKTVNDKVAAIEGKIPSQASASNQLADKDFVNSSIATETATFRGTFNLVTDLELPLDATHNQVAQAIRVALVAAGVTPDDNDYAFVQIPQDAEHTDAMKQVDRYKCTVVGSSQTWAYEWTLNNSSFTAEQWAAINSGITSGAVAKLGALPTAAELAQALASKADETVTVEYALPDECFPIVYGTSSSETTTVGTADEVDIVPVDGPGQNVLQLVRKSNGDIIANFRRDTLRYWSTGSSFSILSFGQREPTSGTWPELVRRGGTVVRSAELEGALGKKQDTLTFDNAPTTGSNNPVKSGGIWSAIWGTASTAFSSLYDWVVAQLAGKASKSDVDSLLFAQYYPDGNVKSAAEFTAGIKYNAPDTTNRTITVKPFCDTGDSENDNSNLSGRVVIPPFVDAQGNGYISDDGTRFKVVGVSGGAMNGMNFMLTTIVAPNTATSIGDSAFGDCNSLSSLSLPAVTSIGDYAFFDCTSLTSISLPAATTIGGGAFVLCSSLDTVDFGDIPRSSVPSLGSNAFNDVPTTCQIIVPYTQYDAWIAADGWKDLPQEFVRHAEKADKPANFTPGNLAALDASGNPTDSGIKPFDKLDSTSAAPAFSSDSTVQYAVGSHCTYNGKLYVCTTATTGGTWVAGSWTADTMTDPDAVLDITAQNQLRVVAKDGTLLWAQGYDLASTSSATLACDACNNFTFADGATTQAFTLPTAPTGKVGDFGLDIDNSANTSAATMTLTGLDTTFSVVVPKGESLNDMLSIAAGELARFYITLSSFRVNNLPTWHILKQVVENGGAQS